MALLSIAACQSFNPPHGADSDNGDARESARPVDGTLSPRSGAAGGVLLAPGIADGAGPPLAGARVLVVADERAEELFGSGWDAEAAYFSAPIPQESDGVEIATTGDDGSFSSQVPPPAWVCVLGGVPDRVLGCARVYGPSARVVHEEGGVQAIDG